MGDIFGAAGQLGGAAISAGAIKDATKMQIEALEKQKQFVYSELDPTKINTQALAADVDRAQNQLKLQQQTDPALLAARYAAEGKMLQGAEEIGKAPSDVVAAQAAKEALEQGTTGTAAQMKQKLIDAALSEIEAGATLPNDVQAELVKAGLERSGATLGAATSTGLGGNINRQLVGMGALQLKAQRQQQAEQLTQTANALESSRNQLMLSLFPELQQQQTANLANASNVLKESAAEMPPAGLSGESIANLWLARVGATNQLAQSSADAAARGAMAAGQVWGNALGGATRYGAQAINTAFPNAYQTVFGTGGAAPGAGAATPAGYLSM